MKHKGAEYAIRFKDDHWEWEVYDKPRAGGEPVMWGTVGTNKLPASDDDWRDIAVEAACNAVEMLLRRKIAAAT
jgi:hypothetical protein